MHLSMKSKCLYSSSLYHFARLSQAPSLHKSIKKIVIEALNVLGKKKKKWSWAHSVYHYYKSTTTCSEHSSI